MNTRLQVEHPVTERVTGTRSGPRAAAWSRPAQPLPWRQEALRQRGHAIECRVYAEDPANGFLPQAGPLLALPRAGRARASASTAASRKATEVPVQYDPMLAKLDRTRRERARRRSRARSAALRAIPDPRRPHQRCLPARAARSTRRSARAAFTPASSTSTPTQLVPTAEPSPAVAAAAAVAGRDPRTSQRAATRDSAGHDPWTTLRGGDADGGTGRVDHRRRRRDRSAWRTTAARPSTARHSTWLQRRLLANWSSRTTPRSTRVRDVVDDDDLGLPRRQRLRARQLPAEGAATRRQHQGSLTAPMPATVVSVHVAPATLSRAG